MMVETFRGIVYPVEHDLMGHMNVSHYVQKFDQATWSLFATLGITRRYMQDNNRGMVAVDQHLRYQQELVAGDVVAIYSRVVDIGNSSITFTHSMINADSGDVAASADMTGVHFDLAERKSCAFPDNIRKMCGVHNTEQ